MSVAIKTVNLSGGYGNNSVLSDISFEIESGTFTAVVGSNGTGKTTLLKHLIRELPSQKGMIQILGKDIDDYKQIDLAKHISFLSQYSTLNHDFTVREAVSFGRFCHGDENASYKIIDEAIEKTGLEKIKNKNVTRISGGEFQLTMLARALCQNTEIILLDEPTNNLDPKHQLMMMNILRQEVKAGKTVLAVIHDLTSVLNYSEKTLMLKNGNLFAYGDTEKIVTEKNIEDVFGVKCSISLSRDRLLSAFCYSL